MYKIKYFKSYKNANNFLAKNINKYKMQLIFVQDGYAVEFKKLIKAY